MRRFFVFVFLVCFTVPFGASLAGCGSKTVTQFCNGGDSGPIVGQVKSVTLSPTYATYGISLNYAQIGPGSAPARRTARAMPFPCAALPTRPAT